MARYRLLAILVCAIASSCARESDAPSVVRREAREKTGPSFLRRATIWNGEKTGPTRFPECVIVGGAEWKCSGTLIGRNVVLTAAHCKKEVGGKVTKVWVGHKLGDTTSGVELPVVDFSIPTSYDPDTFENDIAVAIVDMEGVSASFVPVSANVEVPATGVPATIAGFGSINDRGTFGFGERRSGEIRVRPCPAGESKKYGCFASADLIGRSTDEFDACSGDSGGPVYAGGRVVAVTSRPFPDASQRCGYGAVYVRTDVHRAFIYSVPGAIWR